MTTNLLITITCQYGADPSYYGSSGGSPYSMAAMDLANFSDDYSNLFETLAMEGFEIKVEPV